MFSGEMLLGSAVTGMRKKTDWDEELPHWRGGNGWDPPLWCDVLGRVVDDVGCLWLSSIVDYTDSSSNGVSSKGRDQI